jgi:hypothetical protein
MIPPLLYVDSDFASDTQTLTQWRVARAVEHPTGWLSRRLGDLLAVVAGPVRELLALTQEHNPLPDPLDAPVMCALTTYPDRRSPVAWTDADGARTQRATEAR